MIGLKNTKLVLSIKKKKLAYYGHVRMQNSLQKLVLEGKVHGKRGRRRRRKSWTGNVSEMTKMSMAKCSVKALDRSEWRTMVPNLYAETELRLIDFFLCSRERDTHRRVQSCRNVTNTHVNYFHEFIFQERS